MPLQPQLCEIDDVVLQIARRLSLIAESDRRLKGRWPLRTLRDAVHNELGVDLPQSPKDGPVGRLIQRQEIVQYPAFERPAEQSNGRMRVYRAIGVDQIHLGVLVNAAAAAVDPTRRDKPGRKGSSGAEIDRFSPRQYERIRTMARHVAWYLNPTAQTEDEAYAAVRGAYLMWDPAEGLDGDWRPLYDLVRASRPPKNRVAADLGAAKALMHFAAAQGFVLRTARSERYLIPTDWAGVQERWVTAAKSPGVAAVLGVNWLLSAIAEVLGPEVDPEALSQEQAERVVCHVQDDLLADRSLTTGHRTSIRRTIRRVMSAGLLPSADVNGWDYRQRNRKSAWSKTVADQIAATVATERRGGGLDRNPTGYGAWRDFPFPVLADPNHPYSLARAIDFHTAKGRERERLGLRAVGSFPREAARRSSNLSFEYWSEATVRIALQQLTSYVGWIQRHTAIDLQSASLADLVTPELISAFVDAVDEGTWTTRAYAQRTLVYLGLIASPCLEDQALIQGQGDLANRFYEASCLATGKGGRDATGRYDGRSLYQQLRETDDVAYDSLGRQRAQAQALEAAYRLALGVDWAYDGMVRVYQAATSVVLDRLGVASTAELCQQWETVTPQRRDLIALRALAIWNQALAAPVRTETMTKIRLGMLEHHPHRLDLQIPARLLKVEANGDYHIQLWSDAKPGFDVDLWRLYSMAGGVRDQLLTSPTGRHRSEGYLWVNDFARARTSRERVLSATLNEACRRIINLAANALGLSAEKRDALARTAHMHSFRHAVAGRLVSNDCVEDARLLLHHRGYETLLAVYADRGRNVSTGRLRAEIISEPRGQHPDADLRVQLEQERAARRALQAQLDQLTALLPPDQRD